MGVQPLFVQKVRDVVGLYLDPPETALVLCVDEKSQIQALDRTQPILPMHARHTGSAASHDYTRHGTTTLLRGPGHLASGKVIGSLHCSPASRRWSSSAFLTAHRRGRSPPTSTCT